VSGPGYSNAQYLSDWFSDLGNRTFSGGYVGISLTSGSDIVPFAFDNVAVTQTGFDTQIQLNFVPGRTSAVHFYWGCNLQFNGRPNLSAKVNISGTNGDFFVQATMYRTEPSDPTPIIATSTGGEGAEVAILPTSQMSLLMEVSSSPSGSLVLNGAGITFSNTDWAENGLCPI
jgi:hypothetical protein